MRLSIQGKDYSSYLNELIFIRLKTKEDRGDQSGILLETERNQEPRGQDLSESNRTVNRRRG